MKAQDLATERALRARRECEESQGAKVACCQLHASHKPCKPLNRKARKGAQSTPSESRALDFRGTCRQLSY